MIGDRSPQERQELVAGSRVQVAGRLVGEHDLRAGDQRARTGDPLLLAARQFRGFVTEPVSEAGRVDDLVEPGTIHVPPGDVQRERDVLLRSERRYQVVGLEDEADLVPTELGE